MKKLLAFCMATLGTFGCLAQTDTVTPATYKEKYRPQYHYTPASRWMGDPSGLIKFNGKYRAYNWGAAESEDLVHWKELNPHSINNIPSNIAAFTGSTVIDRLNSAGYGKDAEIAVFTMFDKDTKKQAQAMAFSLDGGETFNYYDLNPVLDIWSTEFRDPTVIFDEQSQKWIMVVAKALEKKVAFYASDDLKHWEWLSDFGPVGDSEKSWECPDIFRLPVDGNPCNMKWVLVVSVNWAREQYFIGDFNGKEFIAEDEGSYPLYVDSGLDYYASRVFQDYDDKEAPVYTIGWVCTWDYANQQPSEWGKGVWSIPRQYSLRTTPDGLRLYQTPLPALTQLREKPFTFARNLKEGVNNLKEVGKMNNCYELSIEFVTRGKTEPFGTYLCEGDGRRLTLSYDPSSHYLTLFRNNVADTDIEKFERIAFCKAAPVDGVLRLNIFIDKATAEIFVNDGEAVMSCLTYPGENQTGMSLFSLNKSLSVNLTAWPLRSIWQAE